mgnify:CR=1 FL=1
MKLISLKIIFTVFLTLFIFSSGCAKNHRVFINPSVPIHHSDIGKGLPVAVKVIDIRSNNVISKWKFPIVLKKDPIARYFDAEKALNKSFALNPTNADIATDLGSIFIATKNFNKSLSYHEKVAAIVLNIVSILQLPVFPRLHSTGALRPGLW